MHVNFPDPWPKKRHAKHRIIRDTFVQELWRILEAQGSVNLVTDDAPYASVMVEEMRGHGGFVSEFDEPYYVRDLASYGTSWFRKLWESKGRNIHFMKFNKDAL